MKKTYSVNLEQYNGVMNNNSYNSVVSQSTDMRKFLLPAKVLAIVLIFLFSASFVQAATYTSVASGNWNADATWSGTGTPVAGDIVNIVGGFNVTLTADAACASITFTTTTATSLTLGTYKLDVSGAITIPRSGSGFNQIIVGAGTLNAGSIAFTSGGGTNRHQITISTGTVTVTGDITTDNSGASATIIFTGAGTLNAGVGIMTTTTSGGTLTTISGSTVNYNGVTQTVKPVTYAGNLTLSGNGAKTLTGATINGTLSIQGTATATGTSPTYGASAILEYKGSSAQTTSNVEFPASTAVDVTINNASGATLNAAKTTTGMLTMTNGTLDVLNYNLTVGSLTGSSNINKSSSTTATNTLTFGSDNTSTTYSGVISNTAGTVAVTKNGTGTLTLSGSNSYSGATTITAGILQLGSAGSGANSPLGTIAGATSVTSGAALDLNGFTLATTEPLTLNGTGISNSGALTNSSATDVGYSGLITLGSASSIVTNTAGDINITNTGTITGATFGLTLGGSGNGSIASIIGTTSGTITKSGSGSWTVSGANTYTGLTTISAGTLKLGAAGGATYTPLGTTGTGTTVTSGAALDLNGFTLGTTEALTLNGTGISSGGALMNSGTAATYSGLIALGSASSIIGGTGTIAVSNAGTITGATFGITLGGAQGGTLSSILGTTSGTLTKIDAGTWTLGGLNTYTGLTTINGGVIKFGAHGGASSGPLGNIGASSGTIVANGAALDLAGYNENANELLTLNGTGIGGGALRNSGGADTYAGLITLASASSIVGDGGTISVSNSGTITGATFGLTLGGAQGGTLASILGTTSGTLTKEGAGIWTLSGASTYTGLTTIDAGILKLGAAGGGTNSPLGTIGSGTSVTSGAVLDLNGFSLGIAEALTLNGTGISSGGALTNSSATAVNYTGAITLGSTTSINTTGNITLGSNGISGGQDLIKVGSAILSLGSGTADLGSLTISAGTLTSTSGTMSMSGDFTNNSAFTHNSGTVNFDGTTQAIGGSYSATFNNLALAGSGTKTFGKQTTISGNLSISSGVVANLGTGFTHPTGTLTLGGSGQPNGTWGSTSSTATYKNDTYFAATTGMLNVSTASCTGGIWLGLISNDWNTDANWCGGKPTNTTDVIIPSGLTNYPVLGAPGSCRTINDMAGGSISGTGTLTITGNAGVAITNISGTGVTISCPVALPASASISVNGSLEISGAISGAGTTLTKAGTGVLTLSGNNTYTGATAITAGTRCNWNFTEWPFGNNRRSNFRHIRSSS